MRKINFEDRHHDGYLGVLFKTSLAIFNHFLLYKSRPMIPTKFHVNWVFGSGVETKNIFL